MASQMEVDSEQQVLVTNANIPASVTVAVHPLVIMNIAEHWTRVRAQEGKSQKVIGALIGKQDGRHLEVLNSFELVYLIVNDEFVIEKDYYHTKEEQFKQVFSDLDFLGWYSTGTSLTETDRKVHKQICEINDSPLFLRLDPIKKSNEIPLHVYESVIDIVNGQPLTLFVEIRYQLATEEAERIGVDHIARMSGSEGGDHSLSSDHLLAMHSAIKMLYTRVKLLLSYLAAMKEEEVPVDYNILRESHSLCQRLPVLDTKVFKEEFYQQCNDITLMAYLGAITKSCNQLNQFVAKFNVLYDRQNLGRRMRGLFF